jgi:Glycosyl transferase family 11
MIIARLEGGLGNQLFQYAAARMLSKKHSSLLKLDLSWFETQKLRQYKLQNFNISANFATQEEFETIVGNYSITKWLYLKSRRKLGFNQSPSDIANQREVAAIIYGDRYNLFKWWIARVRHKVGLHHAEKALYQKGRYFRAKYHHFDPELLDAPDCVYLDGFWQSEKYFVDVEETIRREFTLRKPQGTLMHQMTKAIDSQCSISLHVRRGDMANDLKASNLHGTCSLDYYNRSIEYITERIAQPHFFIFSDDPDWVKEKLELHFPSTTVSSDSSLADYEELILMSRCQHHIIANSSFSWWGAWLNPGTDKIVISPKKWFASLANEHDTKDQVPNSWIKLS